MEVAERSIKKTRRIAKGYEEKPKLPLDHEEFIARFHDRDAVIWACELHSYFNMKWEHVKKNVSVH